MFSGLVRRELGSEFRRHLPEIRTAVIGVAIDFGQFFRREGEPAQGPQGIVELGDRARAGVRA